ncbi:hypothetical protein J6590_027106 [Homalodisca vitripennis]|nr:hypothetical protein J6590_027106 [Homalodisca vitripennis]
MARRKITSSFMSAVRVERRCMAHLSETLSSLKEFPVFRLVSWRSCCSNLCEDTCCGAGYRCLASRSRATAAVGSPETELRLPVLPSAPRARQGFRERS